MPKSTIMTIRLESELKSCLDKNEWQIQELKAATREADEGDFATPDEEAAVFNKWGSPDVA